MSNDEDLLEQVFREARSRALEIRNEIAVMKNKTSSSTVTVPQLLKGDAIPDVAEPEGKPDVPESSLYYNISTPSGERQAPPKTEDGTDTEDQLAVPARPCCKDDPMAAAGHQPAVEDHALGSVAAVAHEVDGCNMNGPSSASSLATSADNNSWQGVYKDVVNKLNQSRSFKQHFFSGGEIGNLLQQADWAGNLNINCISLRQMTTPFARDTCQAVAIAAETITSCSSQPAAAKAGAAQSILSVLTSSPIYVVEPLQMSCTDAAAADMQISQAQDHSGSNSSSCSGGGAASTDVGSGAGNAVNSVSGHVHSLPDPFQPPQSMPLASAADLPVQAVLRELDELLAWQASRPSVAPVHQQAGGTAAAYVGGSIQQAAAVDGAEGAQQCVHGLDDDAGGTNTRRVTRWLQETQHQHAALCRGNSASWAAAGAGCDLTGSNSKCSTTRTMRRSNSTPTAQTQGPCSSDGACVENCSTSSHCSMTGSSGLREDLLTQLRLAVAFCQGAQLHGQHITAATKAEPAKADSDQRQQGANLTDWAGEAKCSSGTTYHAAVHSCSESGSTADSSCGAIQQHQQQTSTVADLYKPPGLPGTRTRRLSSPEVVWPAVSSPAAVVDTPQLQQSPPSPSRPALLYQKLLQSPLARGSSRGSPKSSKGSKQLHGITTAAGGSGSKLDRRTVRCPAVRQQSAAAAGFSELDTTCPPTANQQQRALAGSGEVTCGACGSPVVAEPTPFTASIVCHRKATARSSAMLPSAATAAAASGLVAGDRAAEWVTPCEALQEEFHSMAREAGKLARPLSPAVEVASLSVSTLRSSAHTRTQMQDSYRKPGVAESADCCSSSASPKCVLVAGTGNYSSRAVNRKALAGLTATPDPHNTRSRRAAAAAAARPPQSLLGACRVAELRRAGYAMSAEKQVSKMKAAAAAAAVASSCEGAMVTSVSCGQLLQEAAVHRALSRVSGYTQDSAAAQQPATAQNEGAEVKAQQQSLRGPGVHTKDAEESAAQPGRSDSEGIAPGPEVVHTARVSSVGGASTAVAGVACRLQPTNTAGSGSAVAMAAASAALQALAAGASRSCLPSSSCRRTPGASDVEDRHSRANSATAASELRVPPEVSRSNSSRSRASGSSSASSGSRRVWRPGGQGTTAKDNCKKLQAYESARRALIGTAAASLSEGTTTASCRSNSSKSASAADTAGSHKKSSVPIMHRSGLALVAGAGTGETWAEPVKTAASQGQVAAALAVVDQGVQANPSTAAGLVSASSLIAELRRKSQPENRQTSPGRLQHSMEPAAGAARPVAQQTPGASYYTGPCSPTIDKVEQAIQAAQVALLQRRWQISQMRKAMQQHGINLAGHVSTTNSPSSCCATSRCRITAGSRAASARPCQPAHDETATHQASSCVIPGKLAAAATAGTATAGHNAQKGECCTGTLAGTYRGCVMPRKLTCHDPPAVSHLSCASAATAAIHRMPADCDVPARSNRGGRASNMRQSERCSSLLAADTCRSISSGGNGATAATLPAWSAPRRVSSNGMTGQELMQYYRRSGAAEAAEAVAAAAETGAAVGSTVPGAMNLDAMLKAYSAMSRRKSNGDKEAALRALMANIIAVAGVQTDPGSSHSGHALVDNWSDIQEDHQYQEESCQHIGAIAALVQEPAEEGAVLPAGADEGAGPITHTNDAQSLAGPGAGIPAGALAAATAEGSGVVIVHKARAAALSSVKLCNTATGRAVLSGIGNISLTVQQAVHWLQVGLARMPPAAGGSNALGAELKQQHAEVLSHDRAGAAGSRPLSPLRPGSPTKGRPYSRPCPPFRCFSAGQDLSEDEELDECVLQQRAATTRIGQLQDDLQFHMDESNQLLLVVPQHMHTQDVQAEAAAGASRYKVTGVSLLSGHGNPHNRTGGIGHSLELVTCVGRHKIVLASQKDWAGLLAGLNAMLLLHERMDASKLLKEDLEAAPVSDMPWSPAVEGVQI